MFPPLPIPEINRSFPCPATRNYMWLRKANSWHEEIALHASPTPIAFATGKIYGAERGSA